MRHFLLLFLLGLLACETSTKDAPPANEWIDYSIETIPVNTSIRALEIGPSGTVWYAGANGKFGYTEDNGETWHHDSLSYNDNYPEFRSLAITDEAVMILSVASPALLYRSEDVGNSWELVYTETDENAFYDAMAFWDNEEGIAIGDPTADCLSILTTRDGGQNWNKLSCDILPASAEGEAAFAASNTNISLIGDHAWIATGGGSSRIWHSPDRGKSWEVFDTPMKQGGTMTGMFTLDFYDENTGITFGGDWESKSNAKGNKAMTNDGGKTWQLLTDGSGPGYRSCVQFVPGGDGREIIAVGIPGIIYSPDQGVHWQLISDEDFYTVRMADKNLAWLAGNGKIGKLSIR
jgi:photosystem II stability/assembly factor-like uncharacterized protein